VKRMFNVSVIHAGTGRAEHWTSLLSVDGTRYGGMGKTLPDSLRDLAANVDARRALEKVRGTGKPGSSLQR